MLFEASRMTSSLSRRDWMAFAEFIEDESLEGLTTLPIYTL